MIEKTIPFQEIIPLPIRVVLHSTQQLQIARQAAILHLDATGGILRKSIYSGKDVYLFSLVPESLGKDLECVAVSDFLTERARVRDVSMWLTHVRCDISLLSNERVDQSHPYIFVTDMSWPLMHAVVHVFAGLFMEEYLRRTFQRLLQGVEADGYFLYVPVT